MNTTEIYSKAFDHMKMVREWRAKTAVELIALRKRAVPGVADIINAEIKRRLRLVPQRLTISRALAQAKVCAEVRNPWDEGHWINPYDTEYYSADGYADGIAEVTHYNHEMALVMTAVATLLKR